MLRGWTWLSAAGALATVIGGAYGQAPISPRATDPYKRSGHPTTFSIWGIAGIKKMDAYRRQAANLAALNPACDRVLWVEFSSLRSTPPADMIFFADCENGWRLYFSSAGLDAEKQKPKP